MNVNEATNYDELIKKADEMTNTLTDEQLNELTETLNDMQENNPTTQEFLDAQKQAAEFSGEGEVGEAIAHINPTTGKIESLEDADSLPYANMTLEEIVADPTIITEDIDISKTIITGDSIKDVAKDVFGNGTAVPLSPTDIDAIVAAADKYKNGEVFAYYQAMPQPVKNLINQTIGSEYLTKMGNFAKNARNDIAKQFLEYIIRDSVVNTELMDLQTSVNAQISELNNESKKIVSNIGEHQKKYFEESILKTASDLEAAGNTEKAELLRRISKSFVQSYTLEEFLEAYKIGKCKVKQIQLDKWNRTCTDFNIRYKKSKSTIPDVSLLLPVLDRHTDKQYDLVVLREFIVAFINYTKNMKSENLDEHTFMYYFINNILSLDYYDKNNEEDHTFHTQLVSTINNFLSVIKDRRNELGKKGGK